MTWDDAQVDMHLNNWNMESVSTPIFAWPILIYLYLLSLILQVTSTMGKR